MVKKKIAKNRVNFVFRATMVSVPLHCGLSSRLHSRGFSEQRDSKLSGKSAYFFINSGIQPPLDNSYVVTLWLNSMSISTLKQKTLLGMTSSHCTNHLQSSIHIFSPICNVFNSSSLLNALIDFKCVLDTILLLQLLWYSWKPVRETSLNLHSIWFLEPGSYFLQVCNTKKDQNLL